jgi:hypothetical protein
MQAINSSVNAIGNLNARRATRLPPTKTNANGSNLYFNMGDWVGTVILPKYNPPPRSY